MSDQGKEPPLEDSKEHKPLSYHDIATKLLCDKFLLTALEFHTELIESGRELKQLKDFFSNPGNFEQHLTPDVIYPIRKYSKPKNKAFYFTLGNLQLVLEVKQR